MKLLQRNLPLLLITFAFLLFAWQGYSSLQSGKTRVCVKSYRQKIATTKDRPFVLFIAGNGNLRGWEKSLRSIFDQEYQNYRVVYFESDLKNEVNQFLLQENPEKQVEILYDGGGKKILESLYRAIHSCKEDEIVVFLDGRDWLAHDQVLSWLNQQYEDFNVWMTYGSSISYPRYKKEKIKPISREVKEKRLHRKEGKKGGLIPPLRSAYAGLLKRVKLEDFFEEGKFISGDIEQMFFLPAAEMAGHHAQYLPEILYVINRDLRPTREEEKLYTQLFYERYTEQISPYCPLTSWEKKPPVVDVVLEGELSLELLQQTLQSMEEFVDGYRKIWVLGAPPTKDGHFKLPVEFLPSREALKKVDSDFFLRVKTGKAFESPLHLRKCAGSCQETGFEKMVFANPSGSHWELSPQIFVGKGDHEEYRVELISKGAFFHVGRKWPHILAFPRAVKESR